MGPASVDIHAQFLRPAGIETLRCESELVHMTKNSAFTRATLFNAAGEIVATASQTARLLRIGAPNEGGAE
jgi:acyl-coenzyme A thioesterase PaaI-like protein